jgi:hypothetical protein
LTVVYPVARGSGPLLAAMAAVLVLDESLSAVALLGVLGVCGGVFLIAGGPGLWRQLRRSSTIREQQAQGAQQADAAQAFAQRRRVLAGLRWGALTGALIAAYTVVDGYAVKVLLIAPVLVDYFGNVLRGPPLCKPAARNGATRWSWPCSGRSPTSWC